jgi:hypothetical protein
MLIVALSDIHGYLNHIGSIAPALTKADIVLIAGDITNFGGLDQIKTVIDKIRKHNINVYAVPGNCDSSNVEQWLGDEGVNLNCNPTEFAGFKIFGFGGSLRCDRHESCKSLEDDLAVCLAHIEEQIEADDKVIVVSHYPAGGTRVDFDGNSHRGSVSIRRFLESNQPVLALSGHIHDAPGVDHIGKTTLVNPGPLRNGSYACIEITETGHINKVELFNV